MQTSDVFDDTSIGAEPEFHTHTGATAGGPREAARRASLAWLGAFATACDVASDTYDRLVNRGAEAREDWQRRADEARRQNAGTRERAEDFVRTGMNVFLDTINVPNKADVDTINVKLNILTRKIDDLQSRESAPSTPSAETPVPFVGPDGETPI